MDVVRGYVSVVAEILSDKTALHASEFSESRKEIRSFETFAKDLLAAVSGIVSPDRGNLEFRRYCTDSAC